MIVVTGATGALNGATVEHLLERVPAEGIAVVARDPERARPFADRGVEVRHGDYADPGSLPTAFRDAEQLLLVSSNDPHADAVALHRGAIGAAVEAGVGRVLYTSHQGAAVGSPFAPADVHARTEQLLADSGLAWTSLRNGFYAHSLAWLAGPWRETGTILVPDDGPVSWTARDDEAEAAAVILAGDRAFDGPVTLTADVAPTFRDVAAAASDLAGRTVECVVDEQQWRATAGEARRLPARLLPRRRAGAVRGRRPAARGAAGPRATELDRGPVSLPAHVSGSRGHSTENQTHGRSPLTWSGGTGPRPRRTRR